MRWRITPDDRPACHCRRGAIAILQTANQRYGADSSSRSQITAAPGSGETPRGWSAIPEQTPQRVRAKPSDAGVPCAFSYVAQGDTHISCFGNLEAD